MLPQRLPQIRWGDTLVGTIPAGAAPGTFPVGPQDLITIPSVAGCGSPRVWQLRVTAKCSDPGPTVLQVRLRHYSGVGSTVAPWTDDLFYLPPPPTDEPRQLWQEVLPAREYRLQVSVGLWSGSSPPTDPISVQIWAVIAPFGLMSETEVIP